MSIHLKDLALLRFRMMTFARDIRQRLLEPSSPEVFVLGNQKSGTTVIAAALAECARVSAALDLHKIHSERMTTAYVNQLLTLPQIMQCCDWSFRTESSKSRF